MPEAWWPDHAESWEDVYERVRPVLEEFKTLEGKHERIAAVAHGGSIDAMLSVWVDSPPMEMSRFYHHNCCFTLVSQKEGRSRVHYVNQVTHLGDRELFFY
jgi:broad specificity phosphatase PhoE